MRRNRVVVMLTDAELATLHRLADAQGKPFGTVAYALLAKALHRLK